MKLAIVTLPMMLSISISTSAFAADRIGESCAGTETIKVGVQPPKTVSFALVFSADLAGKSYCYDRCGPDQTYPISDSHSNPIKLADSNRPGLIRHLTFDRRSQVLIDDQTFDAGLGPIVRKASAKCHAVPFTSPVH